MGKRKNPGRKYFFGCAGYIAKEVVENGSSLGWAPCMDQPLCALADLREQLGRFNIKYIDDVKGIWAYDDPKGALK
ncbi:MAG: hypothetical protein WC107_07375 [Patescibacteria group bacterium]